MTQRTYTRSFAGGELGPGLYGRLDLAKFQTGLAKCLNFLVSPQGPVHSRPGFQYVLKTRSNGAVLVPFEYNADQSFALEFGPGYIRFHTQGGTLLEAPKAVVSLTNPGLVEVTAHGYSNGDWLRIAGSELNGHYGIVSAATANTFSLTDLFGQPLVTTGSYTSGATVARVYQIASPYAAGDLFDLHYVQSADVLTLVHQGYAVRELRRLGATNWTLTTASFVPGVTAPVAPTVTESHAGTLSYTYVATTIAAGTLEESEPSPASTAATNDLTIAGHSNTVALSASVPAAVRYNFYKSRNGIYGFIGQNDGSLQDANIEPDTSKTPPLSHDPFASENPRAVSYFEQRRCFGGGGLSPQTVWMTRSGSESNMTYSIPTQDDDAITARIVAREANIVRHLVPMGGLFALTSAGVWRITAANSDVITPDSFSAVQQSGVGASNVQPAISSNSVLYVQNRGSHVREITYKWQSQSFEADDVSVMSPHLFDFQTVRQLAYARAPVPTLWGVRSDGVLLGMTHVPEHEVKAWHRHDTQGTFKSVCAVAEGDEDGLYAICGRVVLGQAVEYVERMHTRQFARLADAFFVDAGLTYAGPAASTVTGLWHLEGKTVVALADGGVEPAQIVTGGAITLTAPASTVHVGLSYAADFQTLPLTLQSQAFGHGALKNVNEVALRVDQSSGVQVGPDFERLRPYAQRTQLDAYGTAPALVTTTVRLRLDAKWQDEGSVCVRQPDPLPLSILSITIEAAQGG